MYLRPRMTRYGGHAGPYVWGGVTGVTDRDNPWLTAVQQNTATRLVVQAKSYDAEQRFLVNENPLSVRTALGVGFGASGVAGPVFSVDKYGPAMWLNQGSATAHVKGQVALTSNTVWTVEVDLRLMTHSVFQQFWRVGGSSIPSAGIDAAGKVWYHDGSTTHTSASTLNSLLSIAAGDRFQCRVIANGTSADVQVRVPDGSWVDASAGLTVTAANLVADTIYTSSAGAYGAVRGAVFYRLTVFDGDETAEKAAEFLPSLFVGGNRANGDTADDTYGVTWTVTRPSAGSDIPTDNTTRLSFDGTADYGQVVGDDDLMDFVPATGLTVLLDAAFGSGAASGAVFASSANASTDDGVIISRNGANERIQGRVDDGTTVATVGDNADNITYDTRFQAAFAFGDSDHEAYVDGVSVETATDAVGSIAAAGALRLGAEIDGSNKAAFDLYAFAVVGDDMSDTEVAATATEGLAI